MCETIICPLLLSIGHFYLNCVNMKPFNSLVYGRLEGPGVETFFFFFQFSRKSGLSSFYYCLLCLPLCHARCFLFRLKLGYLVGKELVILLFPCVLSEKCFDVFYVFSFPPGVYVGTLNLIALIPGPSILRVT